MIFTKYKVTINHTFLKERILIFFMHKKGDFEKICYVAY